MQRPQPPEDEDELYQAATNEWNNLAQGYARRLVLPIRRAVAPPFIMLLGTWGPH